MKKGILTFTTTLFLVISLNGDYFAGGSYKTFDKGSTVTLPKSDGTLYGDAVAAKYIVQEKLGVNLDFSTYSTGYGPDKVQFSLRNADGTLEIDNFFVLTVGEFEGLDGLVEKVTEKVTKKLVDAAAN